MHPFVVRGFEWDFKVACQIGKEVKRADVHLEAEDRTSRDKGHLKERKEPQKDS